MSGGIVRRVTCRLCGFVILELYAPKASWFAEPISIPIDRINKHYERVHPNQGLGFYTNDYGFEIEETLESSKNKK